MKLKYLVLADGKSPHTFKWLRELINYFEVFLITFNDVSPEIQNLLKKENLFILNRKVKRTGGNYKLILKLPQIKRIIQTIKPNYINAHYLSSYGFLAAVSKPKNVKLIQSTWGTDILVQAFTNKIRYKIAKYSLKKADLITSDAYFMTDKIIEICPSCEGRILTFPFGVEEIPNINVSKKEPFLFFSNRALESNYNIELIVQFFYKFHKTNRNAKLIIANTGSLKGKIKNLIKKLNLENAIKYVGFLSQEEQNLYYAKSSFYISIPSSDATSVSLLEAMSFGCVPIVSNIPANREWVWNNYNGLFFERRNLENFINQIYAFQRKIDYIAKINREIIKSRALWKKNFSMFLSHL